MKLTISSRKFILPLLFAFLALTSGIAAQTGPRVGEKLTYSIQVGPFIGAGYAETQVMSQGRLSGKDAIEIHAKVKTLEFVSAAYFMIDQTRTIYVAPDTGLPLYVSKVSSAGATPTETIVNNLSTPTESFDIFSLLYAARGGDGNGTYSLFENGKTFEVRLRQAGGEHLHTDAGEFDTKISVVESDYLASIGCKDLRIHFSNDAARIPVAIVFQSSKGVVRVLLNGVVSPAADVVPSFATPTPTPTPKPTPRPASAPYVENQPLSSELGFKLGESLDYRISAGGKPLAVLNFQAVARKLYNREDSLQLVAKIASAEPNNGLFRAGDYASVQVDPDTLAPTWSETKFDSTLAGLHQALTFDKVTGNVKVGNSAAIEAPVGTHSILSLIYAMRSFNLQPSKTPGNPVNDTRVAVFWDAKPYIFILRPSNPETILMNGVKVQAQLVSVTTGNPQLDALSPKVWLGLDEARTPLRFSLGTLQADLITRSG